MSDRLRILFAGSGAFGLPTLRTLADQHDVIRVYTQPDKPAGRGKKLTPTPIAQWAGEASLDLVKTPKFNDETLPAADALVVIAFGQKISQTQANHARLGSMNLHASLLPRYRGAAPIHHALLAGETVVGNSVIRLAEQMDAGDVLGQSKLAVNPSETTAELHDRLADDGPSLVLGVLQQLAGGTAVEQAQDHDAATHAGKLSRDDAVLDFAQPATAVAAKINALSPWPGCRV
ncbi:MAG: methionyl-tRNA formyltransferase, partial [Planctomycetota bacterium]